jgi:hypothetical protein
LVYRFNTVAGDVRRDGAAKRAGDPEQTGTEAALAATESALKNEDLASAVSALKRLKPSPTESIGPWIQEAEARLRAETTLVALDASLARRLRDSSSASATQP